MRFQFPLFQSHLDLAHHYWKQLVDQAAIAIDTTCGNGHDTLFLAQLGYRVVAIDIQQAAIETTKQRLSAHLPLENLNAVSFYQQCHSSFPSMLQGENVKLIVYNLGYLPGGDKTRTTMVSSTIKSLQAALVLLCPGGILSITCYPGHLEGKIEEERVLEFIQKLDPKQWSCCVHRWCNRQAAPSLLLIQKEK